MRIAVFNHHTPWLWMLAQALPDHTFDALPTPHAPEGWRYDQRPQPGNVNAWGGDGAHDQERLDYWNALHTGEADRPALLLCATEEDVVLALGAREAHHDAPRLFVLHNHAQLLEPGLIGHLGALSLPVVAISTMKAHSLRLAGYWGHLTVIEPYVDTEWFVSRDHDAADYRPGSILTVANGIERPLFDYHWWIGRANSWRIGQDAEVRLVGEQTGHYTYAVGPAQDWWALRDEYRRASVYLNPCCAPLEDAWNLAALEALAAGVHVEARQQREWDALRRHHDPFDPFDRRRFRNAWLVALAENSRG